MEIATLSFLDQHFEEKGIASHKSLSIAFGWSLKESQDILEEYVKKHSEIKPTFCVSGFQRTRDSQWAFVVRLTTSNDSAVDKDLIESKRQIYSIHKTPTINADSLACFDKSLGQDPVSHPSSPVLVKKSSVSSPRPSPMKQLQSQKSGDSVSSVIKAAPKKSVKRQPKSRVQPILKFESNKDELEKSLPVLESAPDPFADSDEGVYEEEAKVIQKKRRRMVFSSDEEDAEGLGVNSKEKEKSDNEGKIESLPEHVSKESAKAPKANHKLPQKGISTKKTILRKTEKETATKKKSESSDEETIKVAPFQGVKSIRSPSPSHGSNPRKRQVTKTFMDDDGFLITEKVWEEVGETNAEPEKTEPTRHPPAAKAKSSSSPVKNATNSKLKKAKQATLMSFFKS